MKKRWLVIPAMAGLVVFALVAGGAVLAQTNGTEGDSPSSKFVSRVAELLGVDEADVQDAFNQAAKEIQDEAIEQKLNKMVEAGRMTREQADEYIEWFQSRPEGLYTGHFSGFKGLGFGKGRGHHFHKWRFSKPSEKAPSGSGATGTSY